MMGERGQTTQDFAIGVSVLLVTIIGVFFFLQTGGLAVYEGTDPGVKQPQADRIASYLVENFSAEDDPNVLRFGEPDGTGIDQVLEGDGGPGQEQLNRLVNNSGVNVSSDRRTNPTVNVSLVNGTTLRDGRRVTATTGSGDPLHWGEYRRTDPATSTRVVQLSGGSVQCDPVCWLVVRVW